MKKELPNFWSFNRERDMLKIKTEGVIWQGPFAWIGYEQTDNPNPIPDIAGVYLFTFEYLDGYILRSVGITNSTRRRFAEHTREYNKGNYTVLDVESAKVGLRKELWHGWQYAKEHQDMFLDNKDVLLLFIQRELTSYRLFICETADKRRRERIEAALLINAYSSKDPLHDLIDGGMALRGRHNYEMPIEIKNVCPCKLYGFPETLEI